MPPCLLRKPKLRTDCYGYYEAFYALSGRRNYGRAGPQPVPISEMVAYCDVFGVPKGYIRAKFVRLMARMDAAYLQRVHSK